MPKGRPQGSRNKPKTDPKPRKPYTSLIRTKTVVKEDLLERLKREVAQQALAIIPCDSFEAWLATFATHEGNDYERQDQHEHTYNSTHHRVVTYACNHRPGSLDLEAADALGCDRILDVYYFYETSDYQIVKLEEHSHAPRKEPKDMIEKFEQLPGITRLNAGSGGGIEA